MGAWKLMFVFINRVDNVIWPPYARGELLNYFINSLDKTKYNISCNFEYVATLRPI